MPKLFYRCCVCLLLLSCTKEVPAPLGSPDSKLSMLLNGIAWESNQVFNGTSPTAFNTASTIADGSKWLTAVTAQNSADDYLYFTILYSARPQADKAYPFQLVSVKIDGKGYAGGPVTGTSGTVIFTSVTDSSLSGTFSGRIALIEGASSIAGYSDITEGKFTKIKYKP